MVNWLAPVHHDYEGALTPQKVDEELNKGIDRKGLEKISILLAQ